MTFWLTKTHRKIKVTTEIDEFGVVNNLKYNEFMCVFAGEE